MNAFINNGNYRNRTLNVSKCLNINYKINSINQPFSVFCPTCNLPFNSKIRINPCYHIICSKCYDISVTQQSCLLCNNYINDVDYIFINDKIFICPFNECKKGYLNEKGFNYHIYFKHKFAIENKKIIEKSDSSIIADVQNIKEEDITSKKDILKNNFPNFGKNFKNVESVNSYISTTENEKEFTYDYNKGEFDPDYAIGNNINNTSNGNQNYNINYLDSSKLLLSSSDIKIQNAIQENVFSINNMNFYNNKLNDNKNSANKNVANQYPTSKNNHKLLNPSQISGKWNYNSIPFKSDYNSFNFASTENSSNNQNVPNKKNNQDDDYDYDNLEDLM